MAVSAVRRGLSVTLLALACGAGGLWAGLGVAAPSATVGTERLTVDRDNLWTISAQLTGRYPGASRAQIMVALMRANPDAFVQGNVHRLRVSRPLVVPTAEAVAAEPRQGASELVQQHRRVLSEGGQPMPLPALAEQAPRPPTEASAASAARVDVDGRAASSAMTGMEGASAVPALPKSSASAPSLPMAASSLPEVVQAKASEAAPAGPESRRGLWWGLAGLAAVGALVLWRTLGRASNDEDIDAEDGPSGRPSTLLRQQVISSAAADMARAVEAARADHVMVNPPLTQGAAVLPPIARRDLVGQDDRRLQLSIVQAWIESGRFDDAWSLLECIRRAPDAAALADETDALWASLPDSVRASAA